MARKFILENLVKLAQGIGANPSKFMGTKTNISFLGKGPTSNILFQNPVRIKNYLRNRGSDESVLGEINDAMGFATAGKLNPIQLEILNDNLIKIATIMKPSALPSLPSASVTPIAPGITAVKRLIKEGKIEDAWRKFDKGYKGNPDEGMAKFYPEAYKYNTKSTRAGERLYNKITGLDKPRLVRDRLPEPGPGDRAPYMGALNIKTGMSRAIARNLLLKDTRLKLKPEELFMLKEGKGEPLDLMQKYYGRSMSAYDDFLDNVNLQAARPDEFAEMILKNVKLIPAFAEGGLAEILQAPRKRYAKGSGRGRQDPMGGHAHQTAQEMREAAPDQFGGGMNISHGGGDGGATIESPIIDGGQNFTVEPIQTTGQNQYLDKFGAGINRNKAYAAGLLSLEDVMKGDIKPDIYAGISGDNFNIAGQKTKDMTGVDASAMFGPVNVTGSYQDYDGDVNKNISASTQFGNFGIGTNYNFEGKPTLGVNYNTDHLSSGLTYDGQPNFTFGFKKVLEPTPKILGKNYAKGGLAGILEV